MSRVVVVKYSGNPENRFLVRGQYDILLKAGFSALAGSDAYAAYLKKRFSGGATGIKTNCLSRLNPTLIPLVDALSGLLTAAAGTKENDIIVWERTSRELSDAGFALNASSFGRRCLGTDAAGGYDNSRFYESGRVSSMVTRILTEVADHSINLGVLKHHSVAGMSAGMKNMYGAIHNPNKYHANNCSPFAADISNLEPIRTKHRLTLTDAIRVQCDNGPGFSSRSIVHYNGLILSEDPVAADRVALEILDHVRVSSGRQPLAKTSQQVKYLEPAEKIGLGVAALERIDLVVKILAADGSVRDGELLT